MNKTHRTMFFRRLPGMLLLLSLLIFSALLSLRIGSAAMDWSTFWRALLGRPGAETETVILFHLRLPRTAAAVLAGTGLSLSGVLLQGVTGNDLAGPNIIGVNAGAGFVVICLLYFLPSSFLWIPLGAFAGAFSATLLIVSIASKVGRSKSTVVLAGIAVTALLNAGISFIALLEPDLLSTYNAFSVGGLSGVTLQELALPGLMIGACLLCALILSPRINTLCLGDSIASSLGIRVKPLRVVCLILASACAAGAVSFAGLLGFVGLVVPHIARRLTGPSIAHQLITSVLCGSILVTIADLAGRVLFAPSEIPVGIVMALIGAPFFFWLLIRRRYHA